MEISKYRNIDHAGFATIVAVVMISTIALAIGSQISRNGLIGLDLFDLVHNGDGAMASTDSCIEDALLKIRNDANHAIFSQQFNLGSIDCNINMAQAGDVIQVLSIGTDQGYAKRISAEIKIENDRIIITNWNEDN
jgi:hypothetical protein